MGKNEMFRKVVGMKLPDSTLKVLKESTLTLFLSGYFDAKSFGLGVPPRPLLKNSEQTG